jgi:hypothetical protein
MSRPVRRAIIWLVSILGFLALALGAGYMMGPGSYPYSENYELSAPEKDVIEAVKDFKTKRPDMIAPNLISSEGRRDSSYYYFVYFYLPHSNEILLSWIRQSYDGTTNFNLVSVNKGLDLGNWKRVNEDLSSEDNRRIKYEFEAILMHLKIKYKDNGNSMSIW